MRTLVKPTNLPKAKDFYLLCISLVRSKDLKDRLTAIAGNIEAAANEFEAKVQIQKLHTILQSMSPSLGVTEEEMIKVYKNRMAKKNMPGRPWYDKIIALPKHGRCPLCNQRIVTTVDHHLPKQLYPLLCVVPLNLLPACKDCNYDKLAKAPTTAVEETFHPYFDQIDNEQWLVANLHEISPPTITFEVIPPPTWPTSLGARIQNHFKILDLNKLYSSHAAEELTTLRYNCMLVYDRAGMDGVRAHLTESFHSCRAVFLNSWKTAMYRNLAYSDWYCDGGFRDFT